MSDWKAISPDEAPNHREITVYLYSDQDEVPTGVYVRDSLSALDAMAISCFFAEIAHLKAPEGRIEFEEQDGKIQKNLRAAMDSMRKALLPFGIDTEGGYMILVPRRINHNWVHDPRPKED